MLGFGHVSDRLGRRPAVSLYSFLSAAAIAGLAFRWQYLDSNKGVFWLDMFTLGTYLCVSVGPPSILYHPCISSLLPSSMIDSFAWLFQPYMHVLQPPHPSIYRAGQWLDGLAPSLILLTPPPPMHEPSTHPTRPPAGLGSGLTAVFGSLLAELFPTEIRTAAMGCIYNSARGVQVLSPVVVEFALEQDGLRGALCVPLILACMTGLWVWMLPETRGIKLPTLK